MVSQDGRQWNVDPPISIESLERQRLLERDSHIKSDRDQHGAQEKGDPPCPIDKGSLAESNEQQKKEAGRNKEADRRPQLGKHAVPGALSLGRVFDRDQSRSTPFAAKPNPLNKTQGGKRQRRENARPRVGRQHADQRRRQPHGQHGRHEGRFASDAIAKMAEQEGTHGTREEGETECQIGVERLRLGRGSREEHRPEHERRRNAEDVKVVELDRRADEARERDLADARALRFVCPRGRHCCHARFLESC
jgi:hypothetical protein